MLIDYIIVEIINEDGCPLYEIQKNMEEQGYENIFEGFLEEIKNKAMREITMEFICRDLTSLNTSNQKSIGFGDNTNPWKDDDPITIS